MACAKSDDESLTNDSDEIIEMFCEQCKSRKQIIVPAEGFCVECVEYMCSTCLYYHKIYVPNHKEKDKASMPQDFCLDECLTHHDQLYKFYCKKCDKLACPVCKEKNHQSCSSIIHIPTLVQGMESSTDLANIQRSIDSMVTELTAFEDDIAFKMKDSDKLCNQSKESITKHKAKLEKEFQLQYLTFLKNLESKHKASMEKHEKGKEESLEKFDREKNMELEMFDTKTASIIVKRKRQRKELLTNLTKKGIKLNNELEIIRIALKKEYENEKSEKSALVGKIQKAEALLNSEIYVQLKSDQDKLQKLSSVITGYKDKMLETKHDIGKKKKAKQRCKIFVAMKQAEPYIKTLENDLKAKKENSGISHNVFEAVEEKIDIHCDSKVLFGNLKDKSEIKKRTEKEEPLPLKYIYSNYCLITISDSLSVGIVFYSQKSLCLINMKTKQHIAELSLPSGASDIKYVSENVVAVLLPGIKSTCIQFVEISRYNQLVMGHSIQTDIGCCTSFIVTDRRLILYTNNPAQMHILDMTGNILQKVKLEYDGHVESAVCLNNKTFYALSGKISVLRMNTEGKVTAENKSFTNLFDSMAVDRAGTVYVCEQINEKDKNTGKNIRGKLYQLSADLQTKHELETIYDSVPKCLCYSNKEDTLYIGTKDPKIFVYKLT